MYEEAYLSNDADRESPYYCLFNNDLTREVPPCFIAGAEFDPLLDDSRLLYQTLAAHQQPCEFKLFISGLLVKYTCASCHNAEKKQVGPGFKEVAKRNYSAGQIVSLIYNPQKKNWPDYATEMAPMPQVPKADALKIANWIRSLR